MLLLLQPHWVTVLSLVHSQGNKDDRSAQAVQDEASLSPAATGAGLLTSPRPQAGKAHSIHSVSATIRPLEMRRTAIIREWLCWDDHSDKFEREGTFQRKYRLFSRMRCAALQDLLTSTAAASEYSVCGIPVNSKPEKMFKLSRCVLNYLERG